jgi:hypothetical protein
MIIVGTSLWKQDSVNLVAFPTSPLNSISIVDRDRPEHDGLFAYLL